MNSGERASRDVLGDTLVWRSTAKDRALRRVGEDSKSAVTELVGGVRAKQGAVVGNDGNYGAFPLVCKRRFTNDSRSQ